MPLVSTQSLLLLSAGVSLYVGLFHFAARAEGRANGWLSAWAFCSAAYVVGRFAQLASPDYSAALWSARLSASLAPLFLWTLLNFVGELTNARPSRVTRNLFTCASFALTAIAATTTWFTSDRLVPRLDLFGATYLGSIAGPGMLVLGVYVAVALGWTLVRLARTRVLSATERGTLAVSLTLYAAFGTTSILASLQWIESPGLAEFGPLVVAIGASQLVASRQRHLESDLSELVEQRTAALRASEERYRGLVEHAPIGVASIDRAGNVLATTARLFEMLGLPRELRQAPANLLLNPALQASGAAAFIERALDSGRIIPAATRFPKGNGGMLDLAVVIAPQRTADGEVSGALLLVEDVTERRSVAARLRQSQKMESIGQLAAGIAQGIDPPLAQVRANLAVLKDDCDGLRKTLTASGRNETHAARFAELEELIDESSEGVERAIAIARDMRDVASSGPLGAEPVALGEVLEAVARMASMQRRDGVEVVTRFGDVPRVEGNAGQLRQVFLNLVMNAVQAVGERGHVEIETQRERDGVRVRVRDDGPGIAAEHRDRLFVPFFTTKRAGEGTGLGLFLSYQIVRRHGGEIHVESEPGSGATFDVWLPLARPVALRASA